MTVVVLPGISLVNRGPLSGITDTKRALGYQLLGLGKPMQIARFGQYHRPGLLRDGFDGPTVDERWEPLTVRQELE